MPLLDLLRVLNLGADFLLDIPAKRVRVNIDNTTITRNGVTGELQAIGGAQIPGQVFQAPGIQINTTTAFQTALAGTAAAVPAGGSWLVTVSYGWSHDIQTSDFEGSLLINGAEAGARGILHLQEPKDSAGVDGGTGTGTDQAHGFTRLFPLTLAAGDTPSFDLRWRSTAAGVEAAIWDPVITLGFVAP